MSKKLKREVMKKYVFWYLRKLSETLRFTRLQRNSRVRRIYNIFIKNLKPQTVQIGNNEMFLDATDSLRLSISPEHEKSTVNLLKTKISKGDIVADLGANIGYFTLITAELVGPKGHVFAFEPDPVNFKILSRNINHNGYRNVTLIDAAVANFDGYTKLYLSDSNQAAHRIWGTKGNKYRRVKVIKLDTFFKKRSLKVDLIKMDIEGGEPAALAGMKNLIRISKSIILITEFWPFGINSSGGTVKQYLESLVDMGFVVYDIDEQKKKLVKVRIKDILEKYTIKNKESTNLLCLKK